MTIHAPIPGDAPQFALMREKMLIGGAWVDADGGGLINVSNPATGALIGTVPDGGAGETRRAIEAAAKAYPAWRARPAAERAGLLHKLADLLIANADELAAILTTEQGKPLAEAKGEVLGSAAYVRWFAEEARRVYATPSPPRGRTAAFS